MSHSRTAPSSLLEARVFPSGLKVTDLMAASMRGFLSWTMAGDALGCLRSHTRTVLSALPEARVFPLGLKVTE